MKTLTVGLLFVLIAGTAHAELLRYVDRNGRVHMIDVAGEKSEADGGESSKRSSSHAKIDGNRPSFLQSNADGELGTFPESIEFEKLIRDSAVRHKLSPDLIRAVIYIESGFQPRIVSDAGAQGLMQLMPETAESLGVNDAFDPAENIEGGTSYIARLMERFHGDLVLTLAAYHSGPTRVTRVGAVPAIPQTQDYVRAVMFQYYKYASRRADAAHGR